jgi:hypothetical protein
VTLLTKNVGDIDTCISHTAFLKIIHEGHTFVVCMSFWVRANNCIGGVMVSVFASSVVDRGFKT